MSSTCGMNTISTKNQYIFEMYSWYGHHDSKYLKGLCLLWIMLTSCGCYGISNNQQIYSGFLSKPEDFSHKGPVIWSFHVFFVCCKQTKKTWKLHITGPWWEESIGMVDSPHKGPVRWTCHNVIMEHKSIPSRKPLPGSTSCLHLDLLSILQPEMEEMMAYTCNDVMRSWYNEVIPFLFWYLEYNQW